MAPSLFALLICIALTVPARGQSSVSGSFLIEPIAGLYLSSPIEDATVFGVRATWRRSYDRTYYATLLSGGDSNVIQRNENDFFSRQDKEWDHILFVVGLGSTLLDRDATGTAGLHMNLGLGYSASTTYDLWQTQYPDGTVHRSEHDRSLKGPVVEGSLIGELELFSPRLVLRGTASSYLGVRTPANDFGGESLWWFPGASLTVGVAAGF